MKLTLLEKPLSDDHSRPELVGGPDEIAHLKRLLGNLSPSPQERLLHRTIATFGLVVIVDDDAPPGTLTLYRDES